MAEIVVGLLGPVIELGKCIAAPIVRQFKYLCCFTSNVQSLNKEASKLQYDRFRLQMKVDEAIREARDIDPKVTTWLEEVNEIQQKKSELDTEINKIRGGGYLSVKSRYSASRGAVKIAEAMKQKREYRTAITDISHPPPPASTVPDILEKSMTEFESREKIEEDLMALLKDEEVKMLGICGMGGVGKTTMAHKIKNRAMKENVFGESVMVVVSQPVDEKKIQGEIAENLGLKLEETSLSGRAHRLLRRLRGGKRILIVLDDVWKPLKLEELGIPCESGPKGCTILLTSRNRDIVEANIFKMEILTKEEAWSLFNEKLGTCRVDDSSLAREIANKCKGLPLALVSVAGALKYEKNISAWRNARQQLKSCNPQDLSEVLQDVYIPLKLSYDFLSSPSAQSIFLLCSLFPEDCNIPLWTLTAFAVGLRMFEDIGDLEQARDRTETLVGTLKSRFLLLEGDWNTKERVKMHDIVRDVAIFIASKEKRLTKCGYDSTWISPFIGGERIKLSKGSTFPNLRLLEIDESVNEELQINGISFEGMKELTVLSISNSSFTSLPLTTQNLVTLILEGCDSLKTIFVVGELFNLEVLICDNCNAIGEFPSVTLKCLRLLEISNCKSLEKIVSAGVTSCGDKKITITFQKLESLRLENLENLRVFYQGIESIEFPVLTQLKIRGCPQLKGLVSSSQGFRMGDDGDHNSLQKVSFGKLRKLRLDGIIECDNVWSQIPDGIFSHLEKLKIHDCGNIKSIFSFSTAQNLDSLQVLRISGCEDMVKVIEDEDCSHDSSTRVFQHLQVLSLEGLSRLKTFCNTALGFPELVELYISDCIKMEQVFLWNEKQISSLHPRPITFPKLTSLFLFNLPMINILCKGVESIEFPLLTQMDIRKCPNLKSLFCGDINNEVVGKLKEQTEYFMLSIWYQIPIGNFTRLELLTIGGYNDVSSLFSSSLAAGLINLKSLLITRCENMVKVIEEEVEEYSHETTLFPHLEWLRLFYLPELKIFCEWKCALMLPALEGVFINSCSKMDRFSLGSLTTPKLKTIQIKGDGDAITITGDLNNVLMQHFIGLKEKETLRWGQSTRRTEEKEESTSDE
ncbi:hypothetical protein ACS0TY_009310 [Phlomoides rotata]